MELADDGSWVGRVLQYWSLWCSIRRLGWDSIIRGAGRGGAGEGGARRREAGHPTGRVRDCYRFLVKDPEGCVHQACARGPSTANSINELRSMNVILPTVVSIYESSSVRHRLLLLIFRAEGEGGSSRTPTTAGLWWRWPGATTASSRPTPG